MPRGVRHLDCEAWVKERAFSANTTDAWKWWARSRCLWEARLKGPAWLVVRVTALPSRSWALGVRKGWAWFQGWEKEALKVTGGEAEDHVEGELEGSSALSSVMTWGWDGRSGKEGFYVYIQLSHVVILQKWTQRCKAIILQFKKIQVLPSSPWPSLRHLPSSCPLFCTWAALAQGGWGWEWGSWPCFKRHRVPYPPNG